MANSKQSIQSVEKVYSLIETIELFVLDFSVLMFMGDDKLLQWLAKNVSTGNKKVVICKEFYRNYSIVAASENQKQRGIAKNARILLNSLKERKTLISDSKFQTTEDLISGLRNNPKVAFLISEYSEAAEIICSYQEAKAKVFVVNHEGKFYCLSASEFQKKRIAVVNSNIDNGKIIKPISIPTENSLLRTKDGTEIKLGKQISKGAEGTVYYTDNDKYVCKIYHKNQITVLRCQKLKLFENRPIEYEGICWPEKIVYDYNGIPVGYIMKKAYGKTMSTVFDGDEAVLSYFSNINRSYLIGIAIRILEKIQYLHLLGVIVGDIRPQNIVIDKDGSVYLIDMDSCQINDFPCPFGDEDYTPPENQKKVFSSFLRTYENEKFSCFVLTFVTLFLGVHPYSQKNGADTMAEEIEMRSFPYPQNNNEDCSKAPFGGYDLIWKHSPKPLCEMFFEVFREDKRPCLASLIFMLDSYKEYLEKNCNSEDPLQQVSYYNYREPETTSYQPDINETDLIVALAKKSEKHKTDKTGSNVGKIVLALAAFLTLFLLMVYLFIYIDIYINSGSAPFWQPIIYIYDAISNIAGGM